MTFLLDTNVVSELRRGDRCDPNVSAWYAGVEETDIFLSVLVLGEMRRGIERIRRRDPQQTVVLERWLDEIVLRFAGRILPIDEMTAEAWGRTYYVRNAPVVDGLLAATAIVHDLTLVTRNVSDVRGLGARVLNPFSDPGWRIRMARRTRTRTPKSVGNITHEEARRRNLPSAEHQPLMRDEERHPIRLAYERRNRDLDPQLVWRGKDEQDWSDLVVNAPPLYIQERVHPKALVDDLMRQTAKRRDAEAEGFQSGLRGPVFGLQRPAVRGRQDRVLPARRQLGQPDGAGRQPAGDGIAGGA